MARERGARVSRPDRHSAPGGPVARPSSRAGGHPHPARPSRERRLVDGGQLAAAYTAEPPSAGATVTRLARCSVLTMPARPHPVVPPRITRVERVTGVTRRAPFHVALADQVALAAPPGIIDAARSEGPG